MKPGIDRIRGVFDYEKVGGSTLLGVRGRGDHHPRPGAQRRMVDFACDVRGHDRADPGPGAHRRRPLRHACGAPARPPAQPAGTRGARRGDRLVSGHELTVGPSVIRELVGLAALEVPGVARVGRGGAPWRRLLGGRAVTVRVLDDGVIVRIWIVARPGQAVGPLAGQVRSAVAATVERLLGLDLRAVTVLVDGVGG